MKLKQVLSLLLTTEQGFRFALAGAGFFVMLAFLSLTLMLGAWWKDARLSSMAEAVAKARGSWSSPIDELRQALPAAHLFGHRSEDSAYMPITNSQARLTGIIQQGPEEGGGPSFAKAIISVQGGIGKVYQVGEVLQEGVKITEIQPKAVILDNNGHSERLPLNRARLGGMNV